MSYDTEVDLDCDTISDRDFSEVLKDISDYITDEERLCISLFKRIGKQKNSVYLGFLQQNIPHYSGRTLTSSAITHKKKQVFRLFAHLGAMLRFKRENQVDIILKTILTSRQYGIILLYERRMTVKAIKARIGISYQSIFKRYSRAIERLDASNSPVIKRYIQLLGNVLKFSKKHNLV